ncbi:LacI family DNA-binding transcriptional regulator [Halalkalibacter urbisdiaboli]|uniref:LacI family DNA-binding transcriptional regulator n=1 Tax=Halalkalibacter urbisdiaboli TaxID=1960589 RepID=UPI000B4340C5|nr:LacI family DNA-binding transcriptional regulator [Halalkalibacter urbisdiaboli]
MAKKVTMQQIADYLGVSKFVVSKALSGKEGVNATTREKVFEAASKLGYFAQKNKKVNQIKLDQGEKRFDRGTDKKQSVLVLMPNIRFQNRESRYWGKILDGLSSALDNLKYGMVVVTENNVENLSHALNPKGFIGVVSVGVVSTALLLEVNRMGIPLVMIDHEDPLLPCDTIFNNNFDCSMNLTNHLIGLGHTNIQFVGDVQYSRSFYDRFLGFRSALESNNLPFNKEDVLVGVEAEHVVEQMDLWLSKVNRKSLPTAFVCANDDIAKSVTRALEDAGYRVPGDVSIAGFDNMEFTYTMSPTLTTVDVAKQDLGIRAVEMLIRRIQQHDAPFEKLLLAGAIMLRESTIRLRS